MNGSVRNRSAVNIVCYELSVKNRSVLKGNQFRYKQTLCYVIFHNVVHFQILSALYFLDHMAHLTL